MTFYDLGPYVGPAFVGVTALAGGALYWAVSAFVEHRKLRRTVFENLDSAYEGGQFGAEGCCAGLSAFELAVDLTAYAEGCYRQDARKLAPHVRDWLMQKGMPCKG